MSFVSAVDLSMNYVLWMVGVGSLWSSWSPWGAAVVADAVTLGAVIAVV